jgi:hypothetical protein
MSLIWITVYWVAVAAFYAIGYRFRPFVALAFFSVVLSMPGVFVLFYSVFMPQHDSDQGIPYGGAAACMLITAAAEAIPLYLLIRRERRWRA